MTKSIKRCGIAIIIIAIVAVMMSFVGCAPTDGYTYKVTVIGLDGNPYKGATVQICEAGGTDAVCYSSKDTDENGVATFDDSVIQKPETEKVIHILGLPRNLTAEETKIKHGESVTVNLKEEQGGAFVSGKGTGSYKADGKTLDSGFDPYEISVAASTDSIYKIKFTSADQKIFLKFKAAKGIYGIGNYYGDVKFNVSHLCVSGEDVVKPDATISGDEVPETGDILLQFGQPDKDSYRYFELSPASASDTNKDFLFYVTRITAYTEDLDMEGKGEGTYKEDGSIDSASFAPYEVSVALTDYSVMRGVYKIRFSKVVDQKVDQKIFLKFKAAAGVYGVGMYYTGSTELKMNVAHLSVSGDTITKPESGKLATDVDATATDNFYEHGMSATDVKVTNYFKFTQATDGEYQYFELSIDDAQYASKTMYVFFTKVGDFAA